MKSFFLFRGASPRFLEQLLPKISRFCVLLFAVGVMGHLVWGGVKQTSDIFGSWPMLLVSPLLLLMWDESIIPVRFRWILPVTVCLVIHQVAVFARGDVGFGWLAFCLGAVIAFTAVGTFATLALIVGQFLFAVKVKYVASGSYVAGVADVLLIEFGVLFQLVAFCYVLTVIMSKMRDTVISQATELNNHSQNQQHRLADSMKATNEALRELLAAKVRSESLSPNERDDAAKDSAVHLAKFESARSAIKTVSEARS